MSIRLRASALIAILPVVLAGCSDDASSEASPSDPASSSASTSAGPSGTTPGSTPGSASATPTTGGATSPSATAAGPAPATGTEVSLTSISLRVPVEWGAVEPLVNSDSASTGSEDFLYSLGVGENNESAQGDLQEIARTYSQASLYPIKQKVLDNVVINGVTWFHIAAQVSDQTYAEDYGTFVGPVLVTVGLESQSEVSKQDRTATLDAIMASVVLTP